MTIRQPIEEYKNWRILVGILILSMFFVSFSGIYIPLLSSYVEELNGPPYIATASILAIPQLSGALVMLPLCIYADRSGKRLEILIIAMLMGVIAHLVISIKSLTMLILSRALIGVLLFASMPIVTSIYAIITPSKRLGTVLALASGTIAFASGIPQIVSGTLYTLTGGYIILFYIAIASNIIALLIAMPVYIKIWNLAHIKTNIIRFSDLGRIFRIRTIIWLTIGHTIYSIGWNLIFPASLYVMDNVFSIAKEAITAIFGIASITLGLGQYMWGPAIDKWGGKRVIIIGFISSSIITLLIISLTNSSQLYAFLLVLFAIFSSAGPPSVNYITSRSIRPELVSIALSIPWIFAYIASIGSFIAGVLIPSLGLFTTTLTSAILQIIGTTILLKIPEI